MILWMIILLFQINNVDIDSKNVDFYKILLSNKVSFREKGKNTFLGTKMVIKLND